MPPHSKTLTHQHRPSSKPSPGPEAVWPTTRATPELEAVELRRLFAENLALGVHWMKLKELFRGRFDVLYAAVLDVVRDDEAYGILLFETHQHALKACWEFNGVLLENRPVRLRRDRGEFDELRALLKKASGNEVKEPAVEEPAVEGPPELRSHDELPEEKSS